MSRRDIIIAAALAAACLLVFGRAVGFEFLNYDDNAYVYENPWVRGGFTLPGIIWAFNVIDYFYWQPVTWLSHMLDCQLFGLRPAWPHLLNILLHTTNSILVFLIFRRLTGAVWRSAVLAALFALHPLRVESVVWIAERKDVLSGFWFLLMVWAYLRFVERPSGPRYASVLVAFALGLMSKPMLMTAPLLLLLLDYWPLRRRAFAEKMPLFVMAAFTFAVTYAGSRQLRSINWAANLPLGHRIANALVSYAAYLRLSFWPARLAILYPYRLEIAWWKPAAAAALLALLTLAVVRGAARRPYLAFGWLWFLVALAPPSGIVQVGRQAMADRFTYLPSIGLTLAVVWGAADLLARRPRLGASLALAAIVASGAACWAYTGSWRNSVTVFENAVTMTGDNSAAEHYLAAALDDRGRFAEALPHHAAAVRIEPSYFIGQCSYGMALERQGDIAAAADHFTLALRYFPHYPQARFHLGLDLKRLGRPAEARREFEQALELGLDEPDKSRAKQELTP
ncbi:MAG TPA: glycosyltransferase family 39 protein [Bryobacteraceae bacterium]|nr:glycosyltransferase family 39 protein [Bryobacteraceae bacterium]